MAIALFAAAAAPLAHHAIRPCQYNTRLKGQAQPYPLAHRLGNEWNLGGGAGSWSTALHTPGLDILLQSASHCKPQQNPQLSLWVWID
jgi:hypothetical protein